MKKVGEVMLIRNKTYKILDKCNFIDTVSYIGEDGIAENRKRRIISLLKRDFVIRKGRGIENIIIPSKKKPRLTLMAHYDAFPGSRGYNDNGSGVAVLLSLQDLASDYIEIVFTDGEERLGVGADHYFRSRKTESVINIDVAGSGKIVQFQRYSGYSGEIPLQGHDYMERFNVPFSDCMIATEYNIPSLLVFAGSKEEDYLDRIWSMQHGNINDNILELLSENIMARVSDFVRDTVEIYNRKWNNTKRNFFHRSNRRAI